MLSQGLCGGYQRGSAAVCDPNLPCPFARYRFTSIWVAFPDVKASQKMLTLQALSSSLNAGTAMRGCLGRGELLGALRQSVPQNGRVHYKYVLAGGPHKIPVAGGFKTYHPPPLKKYFWTKKRGQGGGGWKPCTFWLF